MEVTNGRIFEKMRNLKWCQNACSSVPTFLYYSHSSKEDIYCILLPYWQWAFLNITAHGFLSLWYRTYGVLRSWYGSSLKEKQWYEMSSSWNSREPEAEQSCLSPKVTWRMKGEADEVICFPGILINVYHLYPGAGGYPMIKCLSYKMMMMLVCLGKLSLPLWRAPMDQNPTPVQRWMHSIIQYILMGDFIKRKPPSCR